ncbi:MAG: hypothetical protein ABI698_05145 [bacterium]
MTERDTVFTKAGGPLRQHTAEGPRPACAGEVESGTTMIDRQPCV